MGESGDTPPYTPRAKSRINLSIFHLVTYINRALINSSKALKQFNINYLITNSYDASNHIIRSEF